MEFFRRYLRQHRLAILLFILSWGLLAAGFALYGHCRWRQWPTLRY